MKRLITGLLLLLFVGTVSAQTPSQPNPADDKAWVPVERTTEKIVLAEQGVIEDGADTWELDFYRNNAYKCGLSGNHTFLVIEPRNAAGKKAPLWVYFHGGGSGYFDKNGDYIALKFQDKDTYNHEESFETLRLVNKGQPVFKKGRFVDSNNTLSRRVKEGYRLLVIGYGDHDQYSGKGTPYPNNPKGGEVNGLQASMSAVEYTIANYPTTHVFAHGTSAGSAGAYALGFAFAQDGIDLTGVVMDSNINTPRKAPIGIAMLKNKSRLLPQKLLPIAERDNKEKWIGTTRGKIDKIGVMIDPDYPFYPEAAVAAGYKSVPMLIVAGTSDPFFGGKAPVIAEAKAAGLGNVAWMWDGLRQAIEGQKDSPHQLLVMEAGHVPTVKKPGHPVHDEVDVFIKRATASRTTYPFAKAAARPNIIVFLVDDYDKPEASAYGGKVLTPNLDRLAREGMRFDNAFVTSTVCTPSRYTFLTGRCASSSYCHAFTELFPKGTQTLPGFNVALEEDNMNVGAVLASNGYATGFVGKYHVGGEHHGPEQLDKLGLHDIPKNVPYSKAINRKQNENEKRHRELIKDRGFTWAKHVYWGNMKAPFGMHNPEWTIEAAVEFIEQHKDQPFYLHYATTLLHGPNKSWYKSLDHPRMTGEGLVNRDPALSTRKTVMQRIQEAGLTEDEAGYLWMDDTLGMILDKLDELKIADNTVVLFIADHGSNNKGSLQKFRGTEVPCLMRWPAGMQAGVVCDELIQNTDFVPTWFELAGAKLPEGYHHDGVSLSPLFQSPQKAVRDHVYCEMGAARAVLTKDYGYITLRYTQEQLAAIRAGDKRTIKSVLGLSGGVSRSWGKHPDAITADQLYDLRNDPEAQNNLAANPDHRDTLDHMRAKLTASLKQFPDRPYGEFVPGGNAAPAEGTDDVFRRLRDLAKNSKRAK